MSHSKYPDINDYHLPKKNVLVLSCMDLRLLDNLLDFLHHDNLTNRYDQFILAGASLCACKKDLKILQDFKKFKPWRQSFKNHLQLAVDLHKIKDVYIVEHQDCGAYKQLLKEGELAQLDTIKEEVDYHTKTAKALADEIHAKSYKEYDDNQQQVAYHLHVHCFFIDLRGAVKWLYSTP